MASRYNDQRYGRSRDRDRLDYEGSGGFGRRGGYTGERRSDEYSDENYFGSGRQQYGQGYTGGYAGRGRFSGGYEDDLSGEGLYGGGIGGYSGGGYQGYTGYYDRERDRDIDRETGRYGGDYSDYRSYNRPSRTYTGSYGRRDYGRTYPESERGYQGREDRGWWDRASDEVASWFGDEEAERRREMDARQGTSYRGRGPRGYTRSDERIREDVNDRLTDNDYLDASDIDVQVNNAEVTLTGIVDSRYAKRLAEDLTEDVSGVRNVENRIRVREGTGITSTAPTTTPPGGYPDRATGATGATTGTTTTTAGTATGTSSRGKTAGT